MPASINTRVRSVATNTELPALLLASMQILTMEIAPAEAHGLDHRPDSIRL
jgi:hypothetical protein